MVNTRLFPVYTNLLTGTPLQVLDFWATLPLLENVILDPEKITELGRYWVELTNQGAQPRVEPGNETPKKPTKHRVRDELWNDRILFLD